MCAVSEPVTVSLLPSPALGCPCRVLPRSSFSLFSCASLSSVLRFDDGGVGSVSGYADGRRLRSGWLSHSWVFPGRMYCLLAVPSGNVLVVWLSVVPRCSSGTLGRVVVPSTQKLRCSGQFLAACFVLFSFFLTLAVRPRCAFVQAGGDVFASVRGKIPTKGGLARTPTSDTVCTPRVPWN